MKITDNRDSNVMPITSVSRRSRFKLSRYGQEESLRLLLAEAELDAPQGRVADYIPELRRANAEDQGISLCFLDGAVVSAGAAHQTFTIQSIAKTTALLYVLESLGSRQVFSRVGKEPTGQPFNSGLSFQVGSKRPTNPMITHLLTSKWVGVKDFGSQNGVEEEVDAVQCPRSRDTASR